MSKPVLKTAYVRMQKYKRNYQYFRYPKRNLHFFFLIVTFLFLCTGNVDILINIKTEQLIVKWNKYFGIFKTKAGVACSFMTYAKKVKNFSLLLSFYRAENGDCSQLFIFGQKISIFPEISSRRLWFGRKKYYFEDLFDLKFRQHYYSPNSRDSSVIAKSHKLNKIFFFK